MPQVLAFAYYQLSWLLYVVRPAWCYRLNADFEDHAEHEYALLVAEHPEWETTPFEGTFADDFGAFDSSPTCSARSATTSACTSRRARPGWPNPRFR